MFGIGRRPKPAAGGEPTQPWSHAPDATPTAPADDGVEQLSDGRVRLTLRWPIQVKHRGDQSTLDVVTIRRARGADLKKAPRESRRDGSTPFESLEFLAQLVEAESVTVALTLLERMDLVDIARISEVVSGFLPGGLKTGQDA